MEICADTNIHSLCFLGVDNSFTAFLNKIGDRAREDGKKAVEAIKAETRNENVEFIYLDLASLAEVKKFAQEVQKRTDTIDLLVNSKVLRVMAKQPR